MPQLAAALLLLIFLAQCIWVIAYVPISSLESSYIEDGLVQLGNMAESGSPERSPLVPLMGAIPVKLFAGKITFEGLDRYRFLIRLPFVFCGLMLGASLWYVARRLYGNFGGFIALALYTFSPIIMARANQVGEDVVAAWGAFGLIFTAIAVAHTLYAPREVILWNWRRILLLGVSIALCIGAQFPMWIVLVPAIAFLLWVGHVRRGAALVIFATACAIAALLLLAFYGFHVAAFAHSLREAQWFQFLPRQLGSSLNYRLGFEFFLQAGLGPLVLVVGALVTFVLWPRTRFFGTAAPLITAAVLLLAALGTEQLSALLFLFVALPFLILFVSGVAVDLLESRYGILANAFVVGALIASAMLDVYGLLQLRHMGVR
ncbi:MAG: glycosyltransferase family 39 protein [Candidatus Korobacteraceae bacterium]